MHWDLLCLLLTMNFKGRSKDYVSDLGLIVYKEQALILVKQAWYLICSTYQIYALHRKPLKTH